MAKKKAAKPRGAKSRTADRVDFEAALGDVERIVARLESGELGLTESLEQYETGIKQLKQCHALLDAAEQRVSVLAGFDADGNPVTQSLQAMEGSAVTTRDETMVRSPRRPGVTLDRDEGGDDALNAGGPIPDSVDDSPGLF